MKGKAAKGEGWGSAFHQLFPRYSGTLIPTAPTDIRYGNFLYYFVLYSVYRHKWSNIKFIADFALVS